MIIRIDSIISRNNESYDEESLKELVESIKNFGVPTPVIVIPVGDDKYELVAGERRLEAAKLAGIREIEVVIKNREDYDFSAATDDSSKRVVKK